MIEVLLDLPVAVALDAGLPPAALAVVREQWVRDALRAFRALAVDRDEDSVRIVDKDG